MHITQRVITGYDISDTHDKLVNLNYKREREQVQKELCNELKHNVAMYMYRSMKKLGEHGCILAAHQFG
jgi:hypothetical protein